VTRPTTVRCRASAVRYTAPHRRRPINAYDASADGQRFLVNAVVEQTQASSALTLVVNWPALLKK
jgi:hypothetical protein